MARSPTSLELRRFRQTGDSSILTGSNVGTNAKGPEAGAADPANERSLPEKFLRVIGVPLKGVAAFVATGVSLLFGLWVLISLTGYDDG